MEGAHGTRGAESASTARGRQRTNRLSRGSIRAIDYVYLNRAAKSRRSGAGWPDRHRRQHQQAKTLATFNNCWSGRLERCPRHSDNARPSAREHQANTRAAWWGENAIAYGVWKIRNSSRKIRELRRVISCATSYGGSTRTPCHTIITTPI